jgi:hypothetical protein
MKQKRPNSQRELTQCICDFSEVVRFGKETTAFRQVLLGDATVARGHNDLNGRPAMADGVSEFEPVHGTWHVHVRKDYPDVAAILKYPDCFIGVGGFNDLKACVLYGSGGTEPDQEFIFDNKNRWSFGPSPRHTLFLACETNLPNSK